MTHTGFSPTSLSRCPARSADTPARQSDEALVEAAKHGHLDSLDALFERHSQRLFRAAYRITRNREDAEDAVQTALLSAFVHIATFDGRSSFTTWLTRITMNSALMLLRKKRAVPVALIEKSWPTESVDLLDSGPSPEDACAWEEQKRILGEALNKLTPRLRKAIELRDLKELTTEETSQLMGITASAVKARVFHGRAKLCETLRRHGVRTPDSSWNRAGTTFFFRISKERHL
jgi:RNA polymerase sigma-70 factor (ECF subfamily)